MTERQSKPWYKKWWGIIIAIFIWPFFLWWFIWAKTSKRVAIKIGATVGVWALCVLSLVMFAAIAPATPQTPTSNVQSHNASVKKPVPKPKVTTKAAVAKTTTPSKTVATTPATPTNTLTGFGATQANWDKTHTPDNRATPGSSYDPGEGTSDCSNFGDRYYAVMGTSSYSMCFPSGQSLATTQSEVMQEFPSDTTILWQGKQTSGEPDECYQMEVHSATLAEGGTDGDAFVEFQTLNPSNTSGNIEYQPSNVNDAMLEFLDNASLSAAPGC
jgi:hypothetical protein